MQVISAYIYSYEVITNYTVNGVYSTYVINKVNIYTYSNNKLINITGLS